MDNKSDGVRRVWSYKPFWRFAVGYTNNEDTARPFYTVREAVCYLAALKREYPDTTVSLYIRQGFFGNQLLEIEVAGRGRGDSSDAISRAVAIVLAIKTSMKRGES